MTQHDDPPRYVTTFDDSLLDKDFDRFPRRAVGRSNRPHWWRAHSASGGPWWFSSAETKHSGRFDLPSPHGTLNTGFTPITCALESLGRQLVGTTIVPATSVRGRVVSELEVEFAWCADFTHPIAVRYGVVPGDVGAPRNENDGYLLTQQLAELFRTKNFGGIISRSRFDASRLGVCMFQFGPAGYHENGVVLQEVLLEDVVEGMGYLVLETPSYRDIDVRGRKPAKEPAI